MTPRLRTLSASCSLLALPLVSACLPSAGSSTAPGRASRQTDGETLVLSPGVDEELPAPKVPPPPAPQAASPPLQSVEYTDQGVPICLEERPDLAEVFVGIRVEAPAAPEDRLLLRTWLVASLEGEDSIRIDPDCKEFLICAWLTQSEASGSASKLAHFFAQPPAAAFYPARQRAMEEAEELYQRSAAFRLAALAESIAQGRATRFGASWSEPKVLDTFIGAPRMLQLSPASLSAEVQAGQLSWTVLSPQDGATIVSILQAELKSSKGSLASPLPKPPEKEKSTDSIVIITDDRFLQSSLYLAWPTLPPGLKRATVALLGTIKQELARADSITGTEVRPASGLSPTPALLVQGPHEALVKLAPELSKRAVALTQSWQGIPAPDPCARPETNERSVTLREIGRPQLIVWGENEPKEPKEEL